MSDPLPAIPRLEEVVARIASMEGDLAIGLNAHRQTANAEILLASSGQLPEGVGVDPRLEDVRVRLRGILLRAADSPGEGYLTPAVKTSILETHREALGRAGTKMRIEVVGLSVPQVYLEQTRLISCGPLDYEMRVRISTSLKIHNCGRWLNPPPELAATMAGEDRDTLVSLPFHPYSNGKLLTATDGKWASTCIGTAGESAWPNLSRANEWPSMFDLVYQVLRRPPRPRDPDNVPYYPMECFDMIFICEKCKVISTPRFVNPLSHLMAHRSSGVGQGDPDLFCRILSTGHEMRLSNGVSRRRMPPGSGASQDCSDSSCNQCWEDVPATPPPVRPVTAAVIEASTPPAVEPTPQPRCRGCRQPLIEGDEDLLELGGLTFHTGCADGWFVCGECEAPSDSESDSFGGMCEGCGEERFRCEQCEEITLNDDSTQDNDGQSFCSSQCLLSYHTA